MYAYWKLWVDVLNIGLDAPASKLAPAPLPRGGARPILLGDVVGSHDGRPKGRDRKSQRDGECRSELSHLR